MKKLVTAALGAMALLSACDDSSTPNGSGLARSSGALSVSSDGKLFVADGDNDALVVVDPKGEKALGTVKVGKGASRVAVGADGLVYVSNRFDRSVSVVDPAKLTELRRIKVGAEPLALSFSDDGAKLFVANNTGRSVSVVDVASAKEEKRIELPADPTGLRVVGGKAYVAYGRSSKVSIIDLSKGELTSQALSLELSTDKTGGETRVPGQATDPVYNPDDGRVYVPHEQSKQDPVPTDLPGAYSGSFGTLPVVANAVVTVDVNTNQVLDAPGFAGGFKDCPECGAPPGMGGGTTATANNGVPPVMSPTSGPMNGPSAAVLDPSGKWLFIANMNSNNVQIVGLADNAASLPAVRVGHGPNGIALDPDGQTAYVYNSFDHTVSVLQGQSGAIVVTREFKVGETNLTPEQDLGRKLFFSADDTRMTNPSTGGIACASCHPGGREDGRTWQFTEGPRNTPTLAGRNLKDTAPYHWDGALEDMHAFKMVVETRMGGSGTQSTGASGALTTSDFNAMLAYLETLPAPENPKKGETLSDAAVRGKKIFEGKAACATCHSGPDFTDNGFHDVGTIGTTQMGAMETFDRRGVNTPPLHNLFATAPYLHNGTIATLRDRVTINPGDKHGVTSQLTAAEVDDLVAYLEEI